MLKLLFNSKNFINKRYEALNFFLNHLALVFIL